MIIEILIKEKLHTKDSANRELRAMDRKKKQK